MEVVWLVAYVAVGISLTSFLWFNSGNDLTVNDLLAILTLAFVWPIIAIVFTFMLLRESNVMSLVIWKRK